MRPLIASGICLLTAIAPAASVAQSQTPAWEKAHLTKKPMAVEQTETFMKRLAQFVFDNHLKKDPQSQQRGMIYEYHVVKQKGQFDQFVQGEGLDTMHDGAWFAAAMVAAWRATGDPFYKEFLRDWVLPFYLKMLNHSDELFATEGAVAREGAMPWGKAWAFQEGEKGFIPYWWDDGGSVSLERSRDKNPVPNRPSIDHTVGKPNPEALLDGYSLGMSNHMAQDIGVMLQLAWLMFKDSDEPADKRLTAELAEAAENLHASRIRHFGYIPMCVAPVAMVSADGELMRRVPAPEGDRYWTLGLHYMQAARDFEPGRRYGAPGFADDQQYTYYHGLARTGGRLTKPLAFKTIADAYTEPMLFHIYCDDWDVPPGINKFDLHPIYFRDGKPEDYRSDRKGPFGGPRPIGSRFGPQNMACCGFALQALRAYPGIWDNVRKRHVAEASDVAPGSGDPDAVWLSSEDDVRDWLRRELGGGLRTWEAIFDQFGYIPTGIGAGQQWDDFSDAGGYAHLIQAAAQWILYQQGKNDWDVHHYPVVLSDPDAP
ncbi:MAG TPA: hypothetical protein VE890_10720 [Thermoguttaceae bacterium]|nr:hypothetical protein [Thermoguttaceae bacterium]